ncbi:MAG: Do family serine endopeptidase [Paludibacter sp.]|jgi:Do/DeqQ family serine protease|nr:Do family serine endopeptidase [Paludibacter sp.]
MTTRKSLKTVGILTGVIIISIVSSVVTSNIIKKSLIVQSSAQSAPAQYAAFTKVPSALENDFTLAAERSIHAVVHVKVKTPMATRGYNFPSDPLFEYFFGRPQQQQRQETPMQEGAGSGVIISSDGYIVTNNHVIDRAKVIEVTLNDNRSFDAKLVGTDPNTDIALIKIEASGLPIINFGSSDSLRVGEWVLAIGNPFNLTSTVTAGIVSAKQRQIGILGAPMKIESFIQTDAAINPGNSGGALVNTRGELIGINTAIASNSGRYEGYGFAVPTSIVSKVVTDIRQYGIVQRALLGVSMRDIDNELAKEHDLKTMEGAYVNEVVKNSAAETAGIKNGDVITEINGEKIKSSSHLQEQIGRFSPGDKINVQVLRGDKKLTFKTELKNSRDNTNLLSQDENSLDVLGAEFKEIDDKTMAKLNLPYGVEIKSLKSGKLQQNGVRTGFIIIKINNQAIRSIEDIQSIFDEVQQSDDRVKMFSIAGMYQNGKIVIYNVPMGK